MSKADTKPPSVNKRFLEASYRGDSEEVLALIEMGANRWKMAFREACRGGNLEIVHLMVARGICRKTTNRRKVLTNACPNEWDNGLLYAARGGQFEIAKLAIVNGARNFRASLCEACGSGNLSLVNLILTEADGSSSEGRGSKVNLTEGDFALAFKSAYLAGKTEIANLMLEKGAKGWNECLLPSQKRGDDEMVKKLLGMGANYWRGTQAVTLTFGDIAENHVGMQKIGRLASEGFDLDDLKAAKMNFEGLGCECEIISLNEALASVESAEEAEEAYVLIVRDALSPLLSSHIPESDYTAAEEVLAEQLALTWDTKAKIRGAVKNKRARYNLCYSTEGQEPDYENEKGRIVAYSDVPLTQAVRASFETHIGEKGKDLVCEGNLYYDSRNTGIGFHGDSERRKVIAIRLGESIPLHYLWFRNYEPQGDTVKLRLNSGDLYMMSSKAVGFDWKSGKKFTLRHAAGCSKYTTYKKKIKRK